MLTILLTITIVSLTIIITFVACFVRVRETNLLQPLVLSSGRGLFGLSAYRTTNTSPRVAEKKTFAKARGVNGQNDSCVCFRACETVSGSWNDRSKRRRLSEVDSRRALRPKNSNTSPLCILAFLSHAAPAEAGPHTTIKH